MSCTDFPGGVVAPPLVAPERRGAADAEEAQITITAEAPMYAVMVIVRRRLAGWYREVYRDGELVADVGPLPLALHEAAEWAANGLATGMGV